VNKGTYSINKWTLTTVLDESSCATNGSGSVEFSLSGGNLNIFTSVGGTQTMMRLIFPPGEPEGIPIGCFDDSWVFTEMAIHSI